MIFSDVTLETETKVEEILTQQEIKYKNYLSDLQKTHEEQKDYLEQRAESLTNENEQLR